MKNKKGITLIEIIVSIVLISIVLVFLFNLLITVNDINEESEIDSTYEITKALLLKTIEEDLIHSNITSISMEEKECNVKKDITSFASENNPYMCKKLKINEDEEDSAFLAIYYYDAYPINKYVITYIHGKTVVTRELDGFEKYNIDVDKNEIKSKIVLKSILYKEKTFYKINVPIIGPDGKDYSMLISYKTP